MGRKYARLVLRSGNNNLKNVLAFIDTGADLTIISTKVAKKLKIKTSNTERRWTASDGDEKQSPITELELRSDDDETSVHLDEVLIEDSPIDKDSGEEVILGLDYLQKTKKVLRFDD
jgi:predicted aspartyl protease